MVLNDKNNQTISFLMNNGNLINSINEINLNNYTSLNDKIDKRDFEEIDKLEKNKDKPSSSFYLVNVDNAFGFIIICRCNQKTFETKIEVLW
uniref:Uncharacterized protein n=1 Tax=Strongyloides venezuelensis TaxID=75913 RepID=A0A0K0FCW7_STRVS